MSTIVNIIYWFFGTAVSLYLLTFALSSIKEKHLRATVLSTLLLVGQATPWLVGGLMLDDSRTPWMATVSVLIAVSAGLFFGPIGRRTVVRIREGGERVDERDVVFAREEYMPGSEKYQIYYALHPELREIDDRTRSLPELLKPGGRYYDDVRSPKTEQVFCRIESLTGDVDGSVAESKQLQSTESNTSWAKRRGLELGADEVGVARLNQRWVYSYVGRGPEEWGSRIVNNHTYVIAFSLEMAYDSVAAAPQLAITEETARQYLNGAEISIRLAREIRARGYSARAHIAGSNYQIMLPPVAQDAGLGELSRMGYLISPKYGARVRLGAVTTDLPLMPDDPVCFGVQEFCEVCKKCATNCPSTSIPSGPREWVRGVEKWPLKVEPCLQYWRAIGTDCGLCMRVCPFSHPPTFVHNVVKAGIKRSAFARQVSTWADDLFYGRKVKYERFLEGLD
ncbi:MAG: reductive dehalogenase domain-containing protein [bacterium]